jgi:hypothetical protein
MSSYLVKYERYAEQAMIEFYQNGRSARFKTLQSIALKYLGLSRGEEA